MDKITHPYVPTLLDQLAGGKIGRREFLRKSTLLGLSAASAYAMAGLADPFARARAEDKPKGGGLRIGMRCMEIKDPHLADFAERSNVIRQVCEYLTLTDKNNITRPYLLEKWEVSDDLKTWTLYVRKDVKWHKRPPPHSRRRGLEFEAGLRPGDRLLDARAVHRLSRPGGRHRPEGRQGQPEEIQQIVVRQRHREGRRPHRQAQRLLAANRGGRTPLPLSDVHPRS